MVAAPFIVGGNAGVTLLSAIPVVFDMTIWNVEVPPLNKQVGVTVKDDTIKLH